MLVTRDDYMTDTKVIFKMCFGKLTLHFDQISL